MINAVLDIKETQPLYGYTEPVTLGDVKNYMKVDFSDDDDLITALITAARQVLEEYTGLSFVPKTLTAILDNSCGNIEIPYGPTTTDIDPTLVVDAVTKIAYDPTQIVIVGYTFKEIQSPQVCNMQISYSAGYATGTLPSALQFAIKAQVFFMYDNRGEKLSASGSNGGTGVKEYSASYVCDAAKQFAKFYRRNHELSL